MPRRIPRIAFAALQNNWRSRAIQSQNLLQHLNRVPRPLSFSSQKYEASRYADEEMQSYPSTISEDLALSEAIRRALIRSRGNQGGKGVQLEELSEKLERIMSYLQLSELSEIVSKLNRYEVVKNKRSLVNLLHIINQNVKRGTIREEHIVDMARTVMQQIRDSISRKSDLVL